MRSRYKVFILCIIALSASLACLHSVYAGGADEFLITTEELTRIKDNPNIRIIDAVDSGIYNRAHIPGAINIFYQSLTNLEERKKTGYPLNVKDAERIFSDAGIDKNTQVIVYDEGDGVFASGVWFVLRFFGHKNVQALDGGFRKWMAEGRPATQSVPKMGKRQFIASPQAKMIATKDWVIENRNRSDIVILDTRSVKEYIGEDIRQGASRGGHIPGAVHLEWVHITGAVNSFKPPEEIEKILKNKKITKDTTVITYCHSGIGRSTKLALALKLLGYDRVLEYTGSWEEWSSDPRLPVEK